MFTQDNTPPIHGSVLVPGKDQERNELSCTVRYGDRSWKVLRVTVNKGERDGNGRDVDR